MVNGFSKCQSSCFIDLASQWGEQTHLAAISPTAKTSPCIYKPNQEEMWISHCPFVMDVSPYPVSDRSCKEPFWCISITFSITVYSSDPPEVLTASVSLNWFWMVLHVLVFTVSYILGHTFIQIIRIYTHCCTNDILLLRSGFRQQDVQ